MNNIYSENGFLIVNIDDCSDDELSIFLYNNLSIIIYKSKSGFLKIYNTDTNICDIDINIKTNNVKDIYNELDKAFIFNKNNIFIYKDNIEILESNIKNNNKNIDLKNISEEEKIFLLNRLYFNVYKDKETGLYSILNSLYNDHLSYRKFNSLNDILLELKLDFKAIGINIY